MCSVLVTSGPEEAGGEIARLVVVLMYLTEVELLQTLVLVSDQLEVRSVSHVVNVGLISDILLVQLVLALPGSFVVIGGVWVEFSISVETVGG